MARIEPWQHIAPNKLQFQLVVRRFARFARFSGFKGDNRTFSTSEFVTYKTGAFLVFDLSTGRVTEGAVGHSTGTVRDDDDAKTFARVHVRLRHTQGDAGRIIFSLHMHGSNPGAEGLFGRTVGLVSPNIDTDLEFTAFLRDGNLFVAGKLFGDGFPDGEVFLRDNGRLGHMVTTFETPHGPTAGPAFRLPGVGTRHLGTFQEGILLDERHRFVGTTPWEDAVASPEKADPRLSLIKVAALEPGLLAFPTDALFDFDKSSIRADGAAVLRELAGLIAKKNIKNATIEGHTDSTGTREHNARLSKARADAVKNWLIAQGLHQAVFFSTVGKGESVPVASNITITGRQQNRRVTIRFN